MTIHAHAIRHDEPSPFPVQASTGVVVLRCDVSMSTPTYRPDWTPALLGRASPTQIKHLAIALTQTVTNRFSAFNTAGYLMFFVALGLMVFSLVILTDTKEVEKEDAFGTYTEKEVYCGTSCIIGLCFAGVSLLLFFIFVIHAVACRTDDTMIAFKKLSASSWGRDRNIVAMPIDFTYRRGTFYHAGLHLFPYNRSDEEKRRLEQEFVDFQSIFAKEPHQQHGRPAPSQVNNGQHIRIEMEEAVNTHNQDHEEALLPQHANDSSSFLDDDDNL